MALPDISKIPRKTWIVAVGIASGATAIMVWRGRAKEEATSEATIVDESNPGYSGVSTVPTGTSPLISPVIIPSTGDPDAGGGALSEMYIGALGALLDAQGALLAPLQTTQQQLLTDLSGTLAGLASAGGSPAGQAPVASMPTPAQPAAVAIPAQPAAVAISATPPPPAYKIEYRNRTKDNGKSGTARRVWCVRQKIHRYPDGRGVVVSEEFVKNGAC